MTLRRRYLGLIGAFAIVVGACGSSSATATPPASTAPAGSTPASTAPSASAAAASADLKFALDAEPTYFSLAYTDLPTSYVVGQIYTGMYRVNNKLAVIPDMASALPDVSADGLTWTIKLKDGIKWQDGSAFTSADVKFTFDLAGSKNCTFIPSFCSDIQTNVASVAAPDPATVVFTLKSKFAPFLVTDLPTPIMPQAAVMASFATFQAAAGKADAAAIKTLYDKIAKATQDKACDGSATQPASCDYATYVTDMETALQSGGVTLGQGQLNKSLYVKADGSPDNTAYGQALFNALGDLNTTLSATQTDQVAAAFRLLDFQQHPIGTGPFKFASYQSGQNVTLDANPTYYAGPVAPAHMYFQIIKDSASEAAALQKGDVNWVYAVVSDALSALQNDPNIQMANYADFGYYFIAFNLRPGHLYSDMNLRQAFTMCIDHDATVAEGNGRPGHPGLREHPARLVGVRSQRPEVHPGRRRRQGADREVRLDARLRRHLREGRQAPVHHAVRPEREAAAHLVRPARGRPAQAVRHRGQGQPGRLLDGPPAPPVVPQQLRHLPRRLVHGPRS